MKRNQVLGWLVGVNLLCAFALRGQESRPASERQGSSARSLTGETQAVTVPDVLSRETQAAAPRLLKFSGVLTELPPGTVSSPLEMTLALYKDELGGEPLWTEIQNVEVDKQGRYTVLLGATLAEGLPVELFPSGEPRWLSVEIQGQPRQPRALLVGVPYALKALDSEKLGGKPASDFVSSASLSDQVRQVMQSQTEVAGQAASTGAQQPGQTKANSTVTPQTGAAGPMFPPSTFRGTNNTQIVLVDQHGTGAGLAGLTASPNAAAGFFLASNTSGTASGVLGVTNNPGGAGVIGVTNATSVGANGVYGKSTSTGGSGVFGDATASSGFTHGVLGQTVSPDGIGVLGIENATTGFNSGVSGQTTSPDGSGVNGNNNAATGFAPGVSGNSASTDGVGVFGNALATSGFATGVQGLTHSPNGEGVAGFGVANGVLGSASATSGFGNGVFGQSFSTSGTGVGGFANANSGFTTGVGGDASASPNGTGVFGSSFRWVGVGGQATAPSGGPAFGVWGDSLSSEGTGVAGFADATSGFNNGVSGQSVSPNGNGVLGVSNVNAGPCNQNFCPEGVGVRGIANGTNGNAYGVLGSTATTGFGAGVLGSADMNSGTAFGVFGQSNSPSGNAIFGHSASPSGFPTALVGFLDSQQGGVAGQFVAHGGAGLILQGLSGPNFNQVFSVDAGGNLNISGNLYVAGSKSSTVQLKSGREVALYAVESPENWFEDFGSAELRGGVAWVPLESTFSEATNAALSYHVFLTPNGDSNGLYVARKTAAGFEVREQGGGSASIAFDYRIVVRRRGYEAIRTAEVQHDAKTADASRQHLVELTNSGTLKKRAAVEVPRSAAAPMARPIPPRPVGPARAAQPVPQIPKVNVPQVPKLNTSQPPQPR